jgi:homoserine dehydrogenase
VPSSSALGLTTDEYNAVEVECTHIGWQLYLGKGAGRMPTASAVVHDLVSLDAGRDRGKDRDGAHHSEVPVEPAAAWPCRWLIRLPGENPAWPVSKIGAAFAAHGVEIVEYRRTRRQSVGAIVLSATAAQGAIEAVAAEIARLPGTVRPPVVLAMEPDA